MISLQILFSSLFTTAEYPIDNIYTFEIYYVYYPALRLLFVYLIVAS